MTIQPTILTRKCGCCGEDVVISKNLIGDAIYYDKKTYHSKCFTDMCNERAASNRKNVSEKWSSILKDMSCIKNDSYTTLMSSIEKEDIFSFIRYSYDITIIPKHIFQKISDINSGSFVGMGGNGIPYAHLYDMWVKKIDMLNRLYDSNIRKGNAMLPAQRVSYDLSVLVNKYDSYKKWLEKQRINQIEEQSKETDIYLTKMILPINESHNDDNNISDLVDDIFGD